ncbi:hypothetical protein [Paenibacillus sp. Cedars]|uniref:hypothetical protein n=1 Tax=Paenibacillus sp. Cedars TaxID=1980674 RepID=UPI001162AC87|nr:hypothetical protein [Paenibacillus sp. Cedars]AWP28717.1 hypothetical protein B9D94_19715 [Paenibacillus sp. Cedars]
MLITDSDVWPLVKARLGLTDDAHKTLAELYIAEVGQRIRHYTNQHQIPNGLLPTWAAMVSAVLAEDQGELLYPPPVPVEVPEVSIGDTSVKPSTVKPAAPPQPNVRLLDKALLDYRVDLNHYRKLRW